MRIGAESLGYGIFGHLLGKSSAASISNSAGHNANMSELLAIEMAEMGENSPIRRAVVYRNKSTGAPLAPSDAILNRIQAMKRMEIQTAAKTQLSIADLEAGREHERASTAFHAQKRKFLEEKVTDLTTAVGQMSTLRDNLEITKEFKRKSAENAVLMGVVRRAMVASIKN